MGVIIYLYFFCCIGRDNIPLFFCCIGRDNIPLFFCCIGRNNIPLFFCCIGCDNIPLFFLRKEVRGEVVITFFFTIVNNNKQERQTSPVISCSLLTFYLFSFSSSSYLSRTLVVSHSVSDTSSSSSYLSRTLVVSHSVSDTSSLLFSFFFFFVFKFCSLGQLKCLNAACLDLKNFLLKQLSPRSFFFSVGPLFYIGST